MIFKNDKARLLMNLISNLAFFLGFIIFLNISHLKIVYQFTMKLNIKKLFAIKKYLFGIKNFFCGRHKITTKIRIDKNEIESCTKLHNY